MHRLLISYDLLEPKRTEKDYKALYAALEALGAKPVQNSVWVVRSDADALDVFERLQGHFGREDRLLVVRIDGFRSRGEINKISRI